MSSCGGGDGGDDAPFTTREDNDDANVFNIAIPMNHLSSFASRVNRPGDGERWQFLAVPPVFLCLRCPQPCFNYHGQWVFRLGSQAA